MEQPKKKVKLDRRGRVRPNTYQKPYTNNFANQPVAECECIPSTSEAEAPSNMDVQFNTEEQYAGEETNAHISSSEEPTITNNDILDLILNHPLEANDSRTDDMFEDYCPQIDEHEEFDIFEEYFPQAADDEQKSEEYEDASESQYGVSGLEEPIYPGHSLSVSNSLLIIWLYAISHSITGTQLADLLTLINIHLLSSHPALGSIYMFKKIFAKMKSSYVKHFYCKNCLSSCGENDLVCKNSFCKRDLHCKGAKEYFLEINVETQLQTLFARTEFVHLLNRQKRRVKKNPDHYEDITDGELYKEMLARGDIHNAQYDLTFTLNTDGIPIFKSSKVSAWPVFLMLSELPYNYRRKMNFMLLCGFWFGTQKPFMNTLMEPLHKSLQNLQVGIQICVNGQTECCHGYLTCLSADLPAKSSTLNMVQFNGQHACVKCLQPGCNFRTESKGNVHIFPFQGNDPTGPRREKDTVKSDAYNATISRKPVNGIKGPSFLMMINSFHYICSTSVDYMHCVLLGVTRTLTNLWFLPKHSKEMFSLYPYLDLVDKRLLKIKPPLTITRLPRTMSDQFKLWKAAELRSWMLYYSLPLLHDVMTYDYFYHYSAFVCAIHLLLQDSVGENDIEQSEKLLNYFVFMMGSLYGERYITLNFHSLLHLPQCVKDLGPLWNYSCFPFENANGELQKCFHGTQFIDLQIVNAVNIMQQLPLLAQAVKPHSIAYNFVNQLLSNRYTNRLQDHSHCCVVGKGYHKSVPKEIFMKLALLIGHPVGNIQFFNRAIINSQTFHSKDYTRVKARNSYTVCYLDSNKYPKYGFVLYFMSHAHTEETEKSIFCAIQPLEGRKADIFELSKNATQDSERKICCDKNILRLKLDFLHAFDCQGASLNIDVIPAEKILRLEVLVQTDSVAFVCREPNSKEANL